MSTDPRAVSNSTNVSADEKYNSIYTFVVRKDNSSAGIMNYFSVLYGVNIQHTVGVYSCHLLLDIHG